MQGFHSLEDTKESKEDQREKKKTRPTQYKESVFLSALPPGESTPRWWNQQVNVSDLQEVELQLSLPSEFQHH